MTGDQGERVMTFPLCLVCLAGNHGADEEVRAAAVFLFSRCTYTLNPTPQKNCGGIGAGPLGACSCTWVEPRLVVLGP